MDSINMLGVIVAKKCAQAFSWAYYVKPLNVRIMNKLEKPEWEERREYLKETILPAILEIMKDFFGNE